MNVGERYAMRWTHPHRLEAVITALEERGVVAQVEHRCGSECYLVQRRKTLPIEGEVRYRYDVFERLYEPMAPPDAIPLPAAK